MKRRQFIQHIGLTTIGMSVLPSLSFASQESLTNFGVALFTLPKSLSEDFEGTLKMISEIGYRELEFFGPYDYSTAAAKEGWKMAANALGFSGSGYFGKSPKELKVILDRYGLSAPSIHIDLPTLQENMGAVAEAAHIVGHKNVGIAMIPDDMRKNLDDYKKTIDIFNEVGANAKKHGLNFFYHNHGYGHSPMEGVIPFQMILENTEADLVKMQLDVFWFTAAKVDPVKYLADNPGRFISLHVKDMSELKTFAGNGGNMGEWMGLFPYLADAGSGVLDLQKILASAKKSGVKHFFLEKDLTPEPEKALQNSFKHLTGLTL
ncbi:MAG: sugar phosphate isomerase/epimerase [Cyclobacteriaceae bacterium]|nr:sugar phosphate isomerase/epimerase [Cyclobacteriaceae bacterium]